MRDRKRILFCAEWDKTLKEYFPLIEAAQRQGFVPFVLVASTCSEQWQSTLKQKDIARVQWEDYLNSAELEERRRTIAGAQQPNRQEKRSSEENISENIFKRELRHFGLFFRTVKQYKRLRQIFEHIFGDVKPDLVVVPGEGNLKRMVPLKIALERNIPTLVLPIFYPSRESYWEQGIKPGNQGLYSDRSWINKIAMRLYPSCFYTKENVSVLKDPGGETLATWMLGLLPKNPWAVGTGLATRVAVQSRYEYNKIIALGGSPEKLVITGKPREDVIFQQIQGAVKERKHMGIDPAQKVIVCSLPHYAEHRMLPWPEHWEQIAFLLASFDQLKDVRVLLSLYPDCDEKVYREFIKTYKAVLPEIHDVFTLMGICDVYVANSTSGTIASAIGAYKPVVAFDFIKNAQPTYKDVVSGISYVFQQNEFVPALERLISDPTAYAQAVALQKKASAELGILDGKSTERIVGQIEDLIRT